MNCDQSFQDDLTPQKKKGDKISEQKIQMTFKIL